MSTWLITGCSTGLGRDVAQAVMQQGHQIAVTARDASTVHTLEEGDVAEVAQLVATNFFGAVEMIKAVLPGMRGRRTGAIVNISSIGAQICPAGSGYYQGYALRADQHQAPDPEQGIGPGARVREVEGWRTRSRPQLGRQTTVAELTNSAAADNPEAPVTRICVVVGSAMSDGFTTPTLTKPPL